MKLAIFYEGDSEGILLQNLFWNYCSNLIPTEDVTEFIDANIPSVLFINCGGYQNVFPDMEKYSYLENTNFLAVRDTEKVLSYKLLQTEATQICKFLNNQNSKWAVFAKPNLEALYGADKNLFNTCVISFYRSTYGPNVTLPTSLHTDIGNLDYSQGLVEVEKLFKKYKISFNKKKLASKFFSQFDFKNTNDSYFVRLRNCLQQLSCNNLI